MLTSIPWRESWKYGEKAYRYCLLDTGHAIGTIRFSANMVGWKAKYLTALSDKDLEILLGFDKVGWIKGEEEFPEIALFIFPKEVKDIYSKVYGVLIMAVVDEMRKVADIWFYPANKHEGKGLV